VGLRVTDLYRIPIRDLALRQRFGLDNHSTNRDWFSSPDDSIRIELTYGGEGWGRLVSAVVIPAEGHIYTLAPAEIPAELTRLGARMK